MREVPTAEPAPVDGDRRIHAARAAPRGAVDVVGLTVAAANAVASREPVAPSIPNLRDAVFRRLLAVADLAAAVGAQVLLSSLSSRPPAPAALLSAPLIVAMAKAAGRYDHDDVVLRKSTLDEIPALLTLAAAYALACSLLALIEGTRTALGDGGAIVLWVSTSALLVALRSGARTVAQRSAPSERVIIVGSANARTSLARCIASDPGARVEVFGFLPLEDERQATGAWTGDSRRRQELSFADLPQLVREHRVDRVLLTPTSADSELMLEAVRATAAIGVKVSIVPRLFEVVGSAVEFDSVGGVTVLGLRRAGLTRSSCAVKRIMDVGGALGGLIALAPLGALVSLAVKLDSPGPVFFRQPRVGRDGRPFAMLKFRSMIDGAEAQRAALESRNETAGLFKLSDDPRITRVGRWLRRTSIDELPQLFNVLRGEMSLVGPRPLIHDEDRLVEGRHRARLQLAPGMTGPWQVLGPHRPPLSEMVKIDYLYAANWSLWSDLKIILRTVAHVLSRRGL